MAIRWLVVVALVALLATTPGSFDRTAMTPLALMLREPTSTANGLPPAPSQAPVVLMRGLQDPLVWLGPDGLYVITPSSRSAGDDTIRRAGPSDGKVEAEAQLPRPGKQRPSFRALGGKLVGNYRAARQRGKVHL